MSEVRCRVRGSNIGMQVGIGGSVVPMGNSASLSGMTSTVWSAIRNLCLVPPTEGKVD